jgi:hypothetical protein
MPSTTRHRRTDARVSHIPAERNRVVDLVRVLALCGVVLGHWLKQGWYVDDSGILRRAGLLGIAPWTHPLTWIFQVIPLFFVVGGYAMPSRGGTPSPSASGTAPGWRGAPTDLHDRRFRCWSSGRWQFPLLRIWVWATNGCASDP